MTEAKKARARSPKNAPKADLVEMAAVAAAEPISPTVAEPAPQPEAPKVEPTESGTLFTSVREQGDVLRHAMSEAVTVSAQGALEVNGKIIDALHSQRDAAIDLWRTAISASHLPGALQAQTSAARQAYEAASAQWKDIAETAARWATRSLEPLQTALHRQER